MHTETPLAVAAESLVNLGLLGICAGVYLGLGLAAGLVSLGLYLILAGYSLGEWATQRRAHR